MKGVTLERPKGKGIREASSFAKGIIASLAIYNKKGKRGFLKEMGPEALQRQIRQGAAVFVAKHKGRVVGFVNYYPSSSGVGWIDWLLVDANHRRKGLGTLMIRSVLDFARKHGEHAVWADTRTNNSKSIRLVKKIGFKKIGVFKKAWYKQDFYLWRRRV